MRYPVFRADVRTEICVFLETNEASVASPGLMLETFKVYIRGVCLSKQLGVLRNIRGCLTHLESAFRYLEALFY